MYIDDVIVYIVVDGVRVCSLVVCILHIYVTSLI